MEVSLRTKIALSIIVSVIMGVIIHTMLGSVVDSPFLQFNLRDASRAALINGEDGQAESDRPERASRDSRNTLNERPSPSYRRGEGGTIRALYITPSMSTRYHTFLWRQFQQYMGDFDIEMQAFPSNYDVRREAGAVRGAIQDGYDVILINPSDADGIRPALREARAAGLIVGTFLTDLPPEARSDRDFHSGVDDIIWGVFAALAIADRFPEGAKVVEVGGGGGRRAVISEGFRLFANDFGLEVIGNRHSERQDSREAQAIMEGFITEFGAAIDGVFVHWDEGAPGVTEALVNAGMGDVFIVSIGGTDVGFQQVLDGHQDATIGPSYENIVRFALQSARYLFDGDDSPVFWPTSVDTITRDNIRNFHWPAW